MIVTNPKVIEYIEEFEAIKALDPLPDIELSGEEQKTLYTITEMFHIDKTFRLYLSLLMRDFAKKRITLGKEELSTALAKIVILAQHLNVKEEQMLFKGTFNWYCELHVLHTYAKNESKAFHNFTIQLAKLLKTTRRNVHGYFIDMKKDNWKIEEVKVNAKKIC